MKVLIIGAGAQGLVISWVLAEAADVSEIVLGDINHNRMKGIAETNPSKKLKTQKLDASDTDGLIKLMQEEEFNLIVNATLTDFNDSIMEACYEAKVNYLDMASNGNFPGGDKNIPVFELAHSGKWKQASLKGLILAGADAGTVNVMAKEAAEKLDEVDSIRIKDYAITECEEPIVLWQPTTYLRDLITPPIIWDNGYKEVLPFSGEEEYDFPPPIDCKAKVYYHNHEEPLTLAKFIGKPVKYIDFKMGEPALPLWKSIYDLGVMDDEPVEVDGNKIAPWKLFAKLLPDTPTAKEMTKLVESGKLKSRMMLTVDVFGRKANQDIHYQMWTEGPDCEKACKRIPGASDISYAVAVSAAVFSLMLLRGQVNHTGVFPPEVFDRVERKIYFELMREQGITVHIRKHTLL
jgi:saccharopine dehydrogenase-like NADP-dependent oxidoreductase